MSAFAPAQRPTLTARGASHVRDSTLFGMEKSACLALPRHSSIIRVGNAELAPKEWPTMRRLETA